MMTLRQAVVFAILMENNKGIIDKSPLYVSEKLQLCNLSAEPEGLLDPLNLAKLHRWMTWWKMEALL